MVTTQMQKWGNSYGVRIPKIILDQMELPPDTRFEVSFENGVILLTPVLPKPTLDELLAQVKPENLHGEVDTGQSVGNEVW